MRPKPDFRDERLTAEPIVYGEDELHHMRCNICGKESKGGGKNSHALALMHAEQSCGCASKPENKDLIIHHIDCPKNCLG